MKFLKKLLIVSVAIVAASGCKKLDIAPTDRFSDLTFWNIDANVYNALNNNYSLLYNSSLYFDAEAISDNAYSPSGDLNVIASGNANSLTAKFANDWSSYYSAIKSCNIFLANVDKNTTLSAAAIALTLPNGMAMFRLLITMPRPKKHKPYPARPKQQ
jgi:hypothetical protein